MTGEYTVLDLFCGLGGFSDAFRESDRWEVVTVDNNDRFDPDLCVDVFWLHPSDFEREFNVILAGPPCKNFSMANQPNPHWDGDTPTSKEVKDSIALVYHTIGLIKGLDPDYWFLENPRQGKLDTVIGQPTGHVTYCQYGMKWQKATNLWGEHPPMEYRRCSPGADCHQPADSGFDSGDEEKHIRDPAIRSKVPFQLSDAIREACERSLDGDVSEQATLRETFSGTARDANVK